MITFLGIIIFIIPFVFLRQFKDKTVGVLTIFTLTFLVHMIVALVTQSLEVFNYSTIITIYTLIDVALLAAYYFKCKSSFKLPNISAILKSIKTIDGKNVFVILAFAIVFFDLYSVHYNFSGVVNSQIGDYKVEKSSYVYPYFSDEWAGISFTNYVIKTNSLPIVNPFRNQLEFKNPLVPYFSTLADIHLFFGFDPLNDFALVSLIVGLIIVTVFFNLLLTLGVGKNISALTILIIPFITNGGNLPGIWFLIPMIVGLIFYLISLIASTKEDSWSLFLSSLVCIFIYPPFIVFVAPTLLAGILRDTKWGWKKTLLPLTSFVVAFVIIGLIVFNSARPDSILNVLSHYLFRSNLVGGILSFPIWVVLPVFVLPFAVLGLWPVFKQKLYFLILPLTIGLVYWYSYINTQQVFIIDFPRVVVITSFLILIFFALSLNYIFGKLEAKFPKRIITIRIVLDSIVAIAIIISLFLSLNYTADESWIGLKMHLNGHPKEQLFSPAPTASRFLTEDDLRLFTGIKEKTFISPPWKGLAISAATGNYPLATKPSVIGVFVLNYNVFVVDSDCEKKLQLAVENKIDYVYSSKFDCFGFRDMGESSEGLTLYKFDTQN